LAPSDGSTVNGILPVRIRLGDAVAGSRLIAAFIDGEPAYGMKVNNPKESTGQVEIDTRRYSNGAHLLSIRDLSGGDGSAIWGGESVTSASITLTIANNVSYSAWQDRSELAVKVDTQAPPGLPNYRLWFFDSSYAKTRFPSSISFVEGSALGTISYSEAPANIGFGNGDVDPVIYSFTQAQPSGGGTGTGIATANPVINQSPSYPCLGLWAATYDDSAVDYVVVSAEPAIDRLNQAGKRWRHDVQLNEGWYYCGGLASGGGCGFFNTIVVPPDNINDPQHKQPQTWPLRGADGNMFFIRKDAGLLLSILSDPSVRNFYGFAHGAPGGFAWLPAATIKQNVKHRYRFVFLDGCESFSGENFSAFGATGAEVATPMAPLTISSYLGNIRPAAFIGNTIEMPGGYKVNPPGVPQEDPTTHVLCNWETFAAIANWHSQFLFYWTLLGYGIVDAKAEANNLAWSANSSPAPKSIAMGENPDGTPIFYDIKVHLKVAGYGNLTFNGYNHADGTGDW